MKFVPKKVTRTVGRQILKTKKNSPHIFFIGGIVGVVGGTVLACRATLQAGDVLDEVNHDIDQVKQMGENRVESDDDYDESQYYRDLGYVYAKGAVKLGRLYALPAAVMVVSVGSLTGSHVQLVRRNTALTAALTSISAAYEKYRDRVREELGEEKELDIYYDARREAVEHTDGAKEVVKIANGAHSEYARVFDEFNANWKRDAEYNRIFLTAQQNYLNQRLEARGHVFLNEVYDCLGMDHSTPGAVVGWVWDGDGDNYIDFGIYEAHNEDFVAGREQSIWLDFNVDGVIYDKI